jgi:4-carboxymuconolactone decarboxylase
LNQTLDESFSLHIDLALAAGAGDEQVRAVLLLVSEYGIAKAWRAHRALMPR